METTQNLDHGEELKKVHELLSKNIDDFKYLVLCNMRLDQNDKSLNESNRIPSEALRLDMNRVSDFQQMPTESLEDWVAREFSPKPAKEESSLTYDVPGESLEEWVAKQSVKPKTIKIARKSVTFVDKIEQWLMDEAKKDLFAEIDGIYASPEGLSPEYIRELGFNLLSLANKLEKLKTKAPSK